MESGLYFACCCLQHIVRAQHMWADSAAGLAQATRPGVRDSYPLLHPSAPGVGRVRKDLPGGRQGLSQVTSALGLALIWLEPHGALTTEGGLLVCGFGSIFAMLVPFTKTVLGSPNSQPSIRFWPCRHRRTASAGSSLSRNSGHYGLPGLCRALHNRLYKIHPTEF